GRRAEGGGPRPARPRVRAAVRHVGRAFAPAGGSARRRARVRRGARRVTADPICDLDLRGIGEAIHAGKLSSVEATEAYLRRIERHDGVLRAYITVMAERALAAAKRADAERQQDRRRGPLHGVPIALKDLIAVAGVRMTAGSRVLAEHVAA